MSDQEFRYRIKPGHKHHRDGKRYGAGDEIVFQRSMARSDIAHKLEPLSEDAEAAAAAPVNQVNTLRKAIREDGAFDLLGTDGRRINVAGISEEIADHILAATTAPEEKAPETPQEPAPVTTDGKPTEDKPSEEEQFKRPYTMEQPGGQGGYVVSDATGKKVHDAPRVSKAVAEELVRANAE
ncbi:hypothetical protein [Thalassobaculum litoreum]|uniref:Uncharacterized protein n=1 Tax=Thalassobaculum litoreum DSM 18839 TaxID=1123362 RepID=A0A8G2BI17_9PROT|nr:hypothetical protein [Thalassobaculum litoreum]SDF83487.1 hypothetical protein SAMN05660686_02468 [Thalassobaculum litoreum DSM 18839]